MNFTLRENKVMNSMSRGNKVKIAKDHGNVHWCVPEDSA